MSMQRRFLNVGGNHRDIVIAVNFQGWQYLLLDIDPQGNPDALCDAWLSRQ